jgi:hypothetical protein
MPGNVGVAAGTCQCEEIQTRLVGPAVAPGICPNGRVDVLNDWYYGSAFRPCGVRSVRTNGDRRVSRLMQ